MINRYIWELYRKTDGEAVIDVFRKGIANGISDGYIEAVIEMRDYYSADKGIVSHTREQLQELRDLVSDVADIPGEDYKEADWKL